MATHGPDLEDLPGSHRTPLPGARWAGPAAPDETATVTVVLRRTPGTGVAPIREFLSAPRFTDRRHLGREEFAARYGSAPDDHAALREFAVAHQLRVTAESRERRTVQLSGTVAALSSAFDVVLERVEYSGGSFRGRTGHVRLPPAIRERVIAVLGLDTRPQARTHLRVLAPGTPGAVSYTPVQVGDAYDFPSAESGEGQCIGLLELGGGYTAADLSQYFSGLGLPVPTVVPVSVDGATNAPSGSTSGPDAEVSLDIEVAGALAPGATLAVYFAPNTDQGFLDALSTAVHDTVRRPSVVSVSWGGPESSWTAQARAAFESVLEDAAALGVTVVASAGDDGADDAGPGTGLSVDFPASSPEVVACGGTRLVLRGAAISEEVVWNDLATGGGATGGGVSVDFSRPTYQADAGVPAGPNGFVGRGVPDVAGDADPSTGFQIRVDGQAIVVGGTSAVAPLWAALFACINQLLGGPLGFVNPRLYALANSGVFHDITSGGNGGYEAGPGWDACTGLGSPSGTRLADALRSE